MRSIELFGKEVIPALHEVPLKPYEPTPRAGERPTTSGIAGLEP